MKFSQTLNGKL